MRLKSRFMVVRVAAFSVVAALVVFAPVSAFAYLEDSSRYTSRTNPQVGTDSTWRWGWGNTLDPDFTVSQVPADGTLEDRRQTLGFVYDLNQLDPLGAGYSTPEFGTSLLSPRAEGSVISGTYDLAALLARSGWTPYPGATIHGEGLYGVSLRFYNQFRVEEPFATDLLAVGVDFTKPSPVENLTSTVGALGATSLWSEYRWRDLRWTPKAYDALSGVGGFKVTVNGTQLPFVHNVAPDPAYEPYAGSLNESSPAMAQVSNVTVEDLPAGESVISVVVVDRATNESAASTLKAYVDTDTPVLSITSPAAGAPAGLSPTFSVKATDGAGIERVKYYIDGAFIGSSSTAPFSFKASLGAYASGQHELKAIAEDHLAGVAGTRVAHTATATRNFVLDKTAPSISSVSGAPNPFFPRKRDGYKDNFKVKFKTSEAGTAKLVIKNSKGTVVRTVTKSVGSGSQSISWTGKQSDGKVRSGTYRWTLSMTDKAGNKRSVSARSVTIKFYELVRVSSGAVRIIER